MRKLKFTYLLVIISNLLLGQSFKTDMSDPFKDDIGTPVLLMKNGITIFQYDDLGERKMFLTVFDKDHKIIVKKKEVDFSKIKYVYHFSYQRSTNTSFWTEENGKAIVYMESEYKPFKVTLDSKTAHVEKEEELENVAFVYSSQANSKTVYHSYVTKGTVDLTTGNRYKINAERIQLKKAEALERKDFSDISKKDFVIYNSSNKEIKKIPFDFVEKKYQDASIMNVLFDNNVIYFVSKEYKIYDRATYDAPITGKGQVGVVCFSKYDLITQKFTHKELFELKDELKLENCTIIPNDDNTFFTLKFIAKTGFQNGNLAKDAQTFYEIFFQPIDPKTFETEKPYDLPSEKLDAFVKSNCNIEEGYKGGMLDKCIVDKKGNLFATKVKNVTDLSDFSKGYIYTQNPELIGVSYFDKKGNEISGVAYPYNSNGTANPYSMTGSVEISKNDFSYILGTGSKSNFIFLNNLSDNFNQPLTKKPGYAKSLDDCNAMAIEIVDGTIKQYYVFGMAADKNDNKYADFARALFDKQTNTIIVKVYDGPGYKTTHAAWIKME